MENNIKFCPKCGKACAADAKFCINCGSPFPTMGCSYEPIKNENKKPRPIIALLQSIAYVAVFMNIQGLVQIVFFIVGLLGEDIMGMPEAAVQSALEYMMETIWLSSIISGILTVAGFAIFFLVRKKNLWKFIKVSKISPAGAIGSTVFGASAQIAAIIVLSIIYSLLPSLAENSASQDLEAMMSAPNHILNFIFIAVVTPFVEELLFRGIVYNKLKIAMKPANAVLISAIIFGVAHGNIEQFSYTVPLGIAMAICYDKYRSFWAPFLIHMGFNGGNYLLGIWEIKYPVLEYVILAVGVGILLMSTAFIFFTEKHKNTTAKGTDNINEAV